MCSKSKQEHDELDSNIDTEFISDMIQTKVIDNDIIIRLVGYIFRKIEEYQPRDMDKGTKEWKEDIIGRFKKGMKYCDFFPEFFKGIFERLEEIKDNIRFYNQIMKVRNGELSPTGLQK